MVSPHTRDAIKQWLGAMTVLHDIEHGKVVADMRDDQRQERRRNESKLRDHRRTRGNLTDDTSRDSGYL